MRKGETRMSRTCHWLILHGILVFSLLSLSSPLSQGSPQSGIAFSYRDFWFFVDEPTTIDYPTMQFTVYNPSTENITAICRFEEIEGIDLQVFFEWNETIILPFQTQQNHYAIYINSTLAVTHTVRIALYSKIQTTNGSALAPAGVITNKISYYTEESGALLTLSILDQSSRPRNSTVFINYKGDESTAWTPIKFLNQSHYYQGFLPLGQYQIQAYDQETGIYGETIFLFNESQAIEVYLQLVNIKIGKVISYHRYNLLYIHFNLTISNYVEAFDFVEIQAILYNLENEKLASVVNPQLSLPQIMDFKIATEFSALKLQAGRYRIQAQIVTTNQIILAVTSQDFTYTPPADPITDLRMLLIFLVIGTGAIIITIPKWTELLRGAKNKLP